MSTGPARSDAARNRALLLDAVDRIALAGDDVTVAAVARRAGLTRATTYRHFPDREALLLAAIAVQAERVLGPLVEQLGALPIAEAMRHLARTVTTTVEDQRHLVRALGDQLEAVVRRVVPDEPLAADLERRGAAGERTGDLGVDWLATAVRAVCLAAARAVADGAAAPVVEEQLVGTLLRLVDADPGEQDRRRTT